MEEKYKQVTDIINRLAAANPYITKEQIAKAKSLYNGDVRPIEKIEEELEAFSEQIAAQGKAKEVDKGMTIPKEEKTAPIADIPVQPTVQPTTVTEETEVAEALEPAKDQSEEIYEPLRVELPGGEKIAELQSMINDALGDPEQLGDSNVMETTTNKDMPKVLVKTPEQNQTSNEGNSSTANDGGYGNVTALLTLTIMFSIVTIIIAFFTILAN